jgi:hypothetical protein
MNTIMTRTRNISPFLPKRKSSLGPYDRSWQTRRKEYGGQQKSALKKRLMKSRNFSIKDRNPERAKYVLSFHDTETGYATLM